MKNSSAEQSQTAVALRPVTDADEQLLYEVYASTRADELAQVLWSEAQRAAFLKMQLTARDRSYRMHYPDIVDRIVVVGQQPAGRLIIVREGAEMRLADIALLPQYRRRGIGTALVKELMAEADETGRPLRLQVERPNEQAKRLYERLGFTTTGENDTHFQMEYRAGAPAGGAEAPILSGGDK